MKAMHILVLCLLTVVMSRPQATPTYSVTDLGSGSAFGINDLGQVVGYSQSTLGIRAFMWQSGTLTDLGVLPGGNDSVAVGINNSGQVVGRSSSSDGDRAVFWEAGTIASLGILPGASGRSEATAINDAGQITGWSDTATGASHAFLFQSGNMTDLGTFPNGFTNQSVGADINKFGVVTGFAASDAYHSVYWQGGVMTQITIPHAFGAGDQATAINDEGVIAGITDLSLPGCLGYRGYVWKNGNATVFGALDETSLSRCTVNYPADINNALQVVGYDYNDVTGYHAFLWDLENGMQDLNSLIDAKDTLIQGAMSINDIGQIVGFGINSNGYRALLLSPIPIPEPETFTLILLALGILGFPEMRRRWYAIA
jgi:probable HAF family extracellular repeat protein